MMEFFLSGSLPLIDFVICDVMSDMANKLLSLSFSPLPLHYSKRENLLSKFTYHYVVLMQLCRHRK